jgi:hypothetical protein
MDAKTQRTFNLILTGSETMITDTHQRKLNDAFDKVHNPKDWRAPIRAVVKKKDLATAIEAIEYFTATQVTVKPAGKNIFRVSSVGYRMGPAGP